MTADTKSGDVRHQLADVISIAICVSIWCDHSPFTTIRCCNETRNFYLQTFDIAQTIKFTVVVNLKR